MSFLYSIENQRFMNFKKFPGSALFFICSLQIGTPQGTYLSVTKQAVF